MEMEKELFAAMANGSVTYKGEGSPKKVGPWNAHPHFKGVYLKSLVSGEGTDGALSAHMVRIDPGCTLESHVHGEEWELHEVLGGEGSLELDGKHHPYHMGRLAVIPKGEAHGVKAGDKGLLLRATFFPALP